MRAIERECGYGNIEHPPVVAFHLVALCDGEAGPDSAAAGRASLVAETDHIEQGDYEEKIVKFILYLIP